MAVAYGSVCEQPTFVGDGEATEKYSQFPMPKAYGHSIVANYAYIHTNAPNKFVSPLQHLQTMASSQQLKAMASSRQLKSVATLLQQMLEMRNGISHNPLIVELQPRLLVPWVLGLEHVLRNGIVLPETVVD